MESWTAWKEEDGKPIGPQGEVAGTLPGTSSSQCQHRARGRRVCLWGPMDQQTRDLVEELVLGWQPIN